MKKIGILTFHAAHNYGSMWQAYALQRVLREKGFNVEEINLRPAAQKRAYCNPIARPGRRTLCRILRHPMQVLAETKKWYKFERFLSRHLQFSAKEYASWEELKPELEREPYNAIVCGGDQIWNTTCEDFSWAYFLPMPFRRTKKFAYAPSMGGFFSRVEQSGEYERIQKYLLDFDRLSVRETSTAQYLRKSLGGAILAVADPVVLLTAKAYEQLLDKAPIIRGDYVLYYTPWFTPAAEDIAVAVGEQKGLRVVTTKGTTQSNPKLIRHNAVGPLEFLNILRHARFVCGQSYHLLVFSLLFHKEFAIINGSKDARMLSLLSSCGLEDRVIDYDNPRLQPVHAVDWQKVDDTLAAMRAEGMAYIESWEI